MVLFFPFPHTVRVRLILGFAAILVATALTSPSAADAAARHRGRVTDSVAGVPGGAPEAGSGSRSGHSGPSADSLEAKPLSPAYENTYAKDFIMDAPWRVTDDDTPIPLSVILKDCDTDDIRQLHWIRCWDVTAGGSTLLWDHDFGDERIGDDPAEANYWTYITTVTEGHAGLPDGTLLTPAHLGYGSGAAIQLKMSVYYRDDFFNYTETRYLRVHVGYGAYPWPSEWYGGDVHYHTMYTNNVAEFGSPLPAVRGAAAAVGLHWLITTDHSCDLDETGDGAWSYATPAWEYTLQTPAGIQTFLRDNTQYGNTWNAIGADVLEFQGPDLRIVRGEETNLASIDDDSPGKTLHAVIANAAYVYSPWCGTVGERPVFPNVPDGLAEVGGGGFAFAAHPMYDLGADFSGFDFAVNGALWGDMDIASGLQFPAFLGLEAFNTRETRYSTNETNPWGDFDAGVAPDRPYPLELSEGIALWDTLLRSGLGNGPLRSEPRRIFLAGGSDAHGDFNFGSYFSLDNYATDNAIGKVQTVAHVPGPYAPGDLPPAEAIMEAVKLGHFIATDGPFLEIGLDRDGDGGWYDAQDLQTGDAGTALPEVPLPLRIRWASLPDFGPISNIRILAGDPGQTTALFSFDPSASGEGFLGETSFDLGGHGFSGPYYFRAECLTSDGDAGHRAYSNPIWITFEESAQVVNASAAFRLRLGASVPNPFQAFTTITFSLSEPGVPDLGIYDIRGRLVRGLLHGRALNAGRHAIVWNGLDDRGAPVSPGVHFAALRVAESVLSAKVIVLR